MPLEFPSSPPKATRIVAKKYQICRKIGNGTFGTVYLVEDVQKNKEKKVLKEVCIGEMADDELKSVDREANLLSKLNHHYIVRMFESFVNQESFYIVMEFCELGDLDKELKSYKSRGAHVSQTQILDWFVQLIVAVQYIHSHKMLHRDLKCKNIFLTGDKTVKIGDFGISKIMTSTEYASTFTGTPYYMSPEVIKHDGYGNKSDIWSLGVILYEVCELKRAFEGGNLMSVMMKVIQGEVPNMSPHRQPFSRVFKKMLSSDPKNRPSATELINDPLVWDHLESFRRRLRERKRDSHNISNTSSTSITSQSSDGSEKKMSARERMRLEKKRRSDEEFERRKQLAYENLMANRARTAARKERENNRPSVIQPVLEIKSINPSYIRHDRNYSYSPVELPRRPITAIHPEPRHEASHHQKHHKDDADLQLDALEKSLEYVKAESLSHAIRRRSKEPLVEVDGGGSSPPHGNINFSETIQNFFDDETKHAESIGHDLSAEIERKKADLAATGASLMTSSSSSLDGVTSSSESDENHAELFETADETCKVDISELELTTVTDRVDNSESESEEVVERGFAAAVKIPEDPDQADTFYSAEPFEDDLLTPHDEIPPGDIFKFKRVSSLEMESGGSITLVSKQHVGHPETLKVTDNMAGLNISQTSENLNSSQKSGQSDQNEEILVNSRQRQIDALRQKCEDSLGPALFTEVYNYIKASRFGDQTVPEDEMIKTLKEMTGNKVQQCFNVDQLIYKEIPLNFA